MAYSTMRASRSSKAGITKPAPKMNHSTSDSRLPASSVSSTDSTASVVAVAPNTIPPTNAETNGFPPASDATRNASRASASVASRREPCCIQPR